MHRQETACTLLSPGSSAVDQFQAIAQSIDGIALAVQPAVEMAGGIFILSSGKDSINAPIVQKAGYDVVIHALSVYMTTSYPAKMI